MIGPSLPEDPTRKKRGRRGGKRRNKDKKRVDKFQRKQQVTHIDTMNEFDDEDDNQLQAVNNAQVEYQEPKEAHKFISDSQRKKLFGDDPHKDKKKTKFGRPNKRRNKPQTLNSSSNFNNPNKRKKTEQVQVNAKRVSKEERIKQVKEAKEDKFEHLKDKASFTPVEDNYDYMELTKYEPRLKPIPVPVNEEPNDDKKAEEGKHKYTLNWKDQAQIYYLNKAILHSDYNLSYYELPQDEGLTPTVPSRREYIYFIHDLFEEFEKTEKPLKGLDIGVGANLIYPILGHKEYGWSFVGSDICKESIKIAQEIIDKNYLNDFITLKLQTGKDLEVNQEDEDEEGHKSIHEIFEGIVDDSNDEQEFDFSMCNPPFFNSVLERIDRKSVKPIKTRREEETTLGGEVGFLCRMIKESIKFKHKIKWFTTFIGRRMDFIFL